MTQNTVFFIRIKVPDQEFDSIRLAVDPATTIRQVKTEVLEQLYPVKAHHKARALIAIGTGPHEGPLFVMSNWTIAQALQSGIQEFELIRTDMLQ